MLARSAVERGDPVARDFPECQNDAQHEAWRENRRSGHDRTFSGRASRRLDADRHLVGHAGDGSSDARIRSASGMKFFNTWQAFALLSAAFAALTAIFGKVGVAGISSNFATFIRTIVILVVSALIISWRAEWGDPRVIPGKSLFFLVLSGVATGLSWLAYYRALQLGPVSSVAPIDKLSVAFAIVLSAVFLGETISWQVAVGGALIVSGSLLIAFA